MYCVVVLHISYDNRLSTARYEVTTQRHVRIAAQRWSEHRMESRRRRHAVSGSALLIDFKFCAFGPSQGICVYDGHKW